MRTGDVEAARADLREKPDGVLEEVAQRRGLSLGEALRLLPAGEATLARGAEFEQIWDELTGWGEILFLIHNAHGVFEIATALSPGSAGHGYFNLSGPAPLRGHLRANLCREIWFVDRPLFGRRSCAMLFLDEAGAAMFKIFVRRDEARQLHPDQLARFEALRAPFGTEG